MTTSLATSLDNLRAALLELDATGANGFEGLMAHVLSKISGHDFRLAKSGLQLGKDGETLPEGAYVSFEAKLYTNDVPAKEVHGKLTQIIGGGGTPPDLWVLGATVEASTQLLAPMISTAEKSGFVVLVLDWPAASPIPPLAAACALARKETGAFLQSNVANAALVSKAKVALLAIAAAPEFEGRAARIRRLLADPTAGTVLARAANRGWLQSAFSDKRIARSVFGQALSPGAAAAIPLQSRPSLVAEVQKLLTAPPSGEIVALMGGDGFGKSWLFAQSWQALQDAPLAVVIPATDLKPVTSHAEILSFFIKRLIEQTGDSDTEQTRMRWQRKFAYWKELPNGPSPRFVVCMDGLNQQEGVQWARWLDGAAAIIEQHGGRLFITVRRTYFDASLRRSLNAKVSAINVPEWTQAELNEILTTAGIDHTGIKSAVLGRLRNPRILGIAFELKDSVQIQSFSELTVERLLFEHIRLGDRDGTPPEPPEEFSKRLAEHAQEIINRVEEQRREDRLVFDRARQSGKGYELTAELLAVAGEHFFKPLPEDSTLYTLSDDGMILALGLSIIRALQKAIRGERDAVEALDELLEPISALDKTAEAVFAAVLISSVDDGCSADIRSALVCAFLRLQNIDTGNYPAFVSAVRNSPDSAMEALAYLLSNSRYASHQDWLIAALRDCRRTPECWAVISSYVSHWLRAYSLDPKLVVMASISHEGADKVREQTQKRTGELEKRVNELSQPEREFLETKMHRKDAPEPGVLADEALGLLAGMPLAPFSDDLVAYAFSHQLNSSIRAPYKEYVALLRFNRKDWSETRAAVLRSGAFLQDATVSRTGRWALVMILRGLSTQDDWERERDLVEELTRDREKWEGWRLVENYCLSDPCDPASERPDNVDNTAQQYEKIPVEEVASNRSMGSEDHFLRDGRPGVARFAPETAIAVQRKVVQQQVQRDPEKLMLAITSMESHSAVLLPETVTRLLDIARTLSAPRDAENTQELREEWITAQFAIQTAFPHLDGNAQLDFLLSLPPHGPPMLTLAHVLNKADPEKLTAVLRRAWESGEHSRQLVALLFARCSGTALSEESRSLVGQFVSSDRPSVRAEAFGIIASLKDENLIQQVVDSGWGAAHLERREHHFEIWKGSLVLIRAAEMGILPADALLDRITPELFGYAAKTVGEHLNPSIAARFGVTVAVALDIDIDFTPPAVEQKYECDPATPPLWSLALPVETSGPEAFFKRLNETPEDFQARQRQGWEAFNRFQADLTKSKARLIIENVGFDAIDAFVNASMANACKLAEVLLNVDARKLVHVQNFALMLAERLSRENAQLARRLFDKLVGRRAFISLTFGDAAVSLEAVCIWGSADGAEMDDLRSRRLDAAKTDYDIAQEVNAALMGGKKAFLEHYVRENLERPEPAANARALMIAGFGLESQFAEGVLTRFENAGGILATAHKAARFAYDRNKWSRHWFERMCKTDSPEEFWCLSALFLKIVDGRFSQWEVDVPRAGSAIQAFEPTISSKMDKRIKSWKSKREKHLCGDDAPSDVFVVLE